MSSGVLGVLGALGAVVLAIAVWPVPQPSHPPRSRQAVRPRRSRALPGARTEAHPPAVLVADVAEALVLLALALRSGLGSLEALERVADVVDPAVRRQLAPVAAAMRWGRSPSEAWGHAPAAWGPAAVAWELAERVGAPPAELLTAAATRVRAAESRRVRAATARAGVLLVMPLGLCFLPAFAATTVIPVVLALARSVLGDPVAP